MRRIESYDEIHALVRGGMKARAKTNCFLTEEDYRAEFSRGSLYLHEWSGGFAFMRRRNGYYIMNLFLLTPGFVPPPPDTVVVCETVRRSSLADELREPLIQGGFKPVLRRLRLTSNKAPAACENDNIERASPDDTAALHSLLLECFDPVTGCIPPMNQLSDDISSGGAFLIRQNGELAAAIHVKGGVIRHLCTLPQYRGAGFATSLVNFASARRTGRLMRVWCARDNSAALSLYKSCGFREDGFESEVLLCAAPGETEQHGNALPAAHSEK